MLSSGQPLAQRQLDTISLHQCLTRALEFNPQIAGARGSTRVAQGAAQVAAAPLFPQVTLLGQASENSSTQRSNAGGNAAPPQSYALSLTGQQLLFDFWKTPLKAGSGKTLYAAARCDSQAAVDGVILATVAAYVSLLQALAIAEVNRDALRQAGRHLDNANALYETGRGLRYAVVKARADSAAARLDLVRSLNAATIQKLQLANIIGVPIADSAVFLDSFPRFGAMPLPDSAQAAALRQRPDLAGARLHVEAARSSAEAAKLARLPSLAASGAVGIKSPELQGPWENTWSVAAALSVPLCSGGAVRGAIAQARGALENAGAALSAAELLAVLDVQQQFAACHEAAERLEVSLQAIEQAQLALTLSQDRFNAGSGNSLEVSDAELSLKHAQISRIQAQADYSISRMRLLRAMGSLSAIIKNP